MSILSHGEIVEFLYSKIVLMSVCLSLSPLANSQQVVVHSKNEITSLSKNMLKAIFSMRIRTWPDGTPITVFIQNVDSEVHKSFCLSKLDVLPYQIQRRWDVLVYSGTGQSPIELNDESDMKQKISQTHGAIGYISEKEEIGKNVISISIH